MTDPGLIDLLDHMRAAASDARGFVEGLSKDAFLADKRTQNAVIMSLVIIGEAATIIMDRYPAYAADRSETPWRNMRGMRNRITHGYFEINLEIVWDTVQPALPKLLLSLSKEAGGAVADLS
jgi:uncharacterized protein with HEPN domain